MKFSKKKIFTIIFVFIFIFSTISTAKGLVARDKAIDVVVFRGDEISQSSTTAYGWIDIREIIYSNYTDLLGYNLTEIQLKVNEINLDKDFVVYFLNHSDFEYELGDDPRKIDYTLKFTQEDGSYSFDSDYPYNANVTILMDKTVIPNVPRSYSFQSENLTESLITTVISVYIIQEESDLNELFYAMDFYPNSLFDLPEETEFDLFGLIFIFLVLGAVIGTSIVFLFLLVINPRSQEKKEKPNIERSRRTSRDKKKDKSN